MKALLREQEGAVTSAQALRAGLTRRQIRTLIESGWRHPFQGVLIEPSVTNPFRSRIRGGLLVCPRAAADGVTAARLHCLWGLPIWHESERLELIFPAGLTAHARRGMRLHTGLRD